MATTIVVSTLAATRAVVIVVACEHISHRTLQQELKDLPAAPPLPLLLPGVVIRVPFLLGRPVAAGRAIDVVGTENEVDVTS